jgi:hypothetical protein
MTTIDPAQIDALISAIATAAEFTRVLQLWLAIQSGLTLAILFGIGLRK